MIVVVVVVVVVGGGGVCVCVGIKIWRVVERKLYPQRLWVNDAASRNMFFMLITFETRHRDRSPLNDVAPWNMPDMRLTFETSHPAME